MANTMGGWTGWGANFQSGSRTCGRKGGPPKSACVMAGEQVTILGNARAFVDEAAPKPLPPVQELHIRAAIVRSSRPTAFA